MWKIAPFRVGLHPQIQRTNKTILPPKLSRHPHHLSFLRPYLEFHTMSPDKMMRLRPPSTKNGIHSDHSPSEELLIGFAKLPNKIQSTIWREAAYTPRTVIVKLNTNGHRPSWHEKATTYLTSPTIPTLLWICQESRYQALKAYDLNLNIEGG